MGINYFLNGQSEKKQHKMLITFYTVNYFSKLFCRNKVVKPNKKELKKKDQTERRVASTQEKRERNVVREWNMSIIIPVQPNEKKIRKTENINFVRFLGFCFFERMWGLKQYVTKLAEKLCT